MNMQLDEEKLTEALSTRNNYLYEGIIVKNTFLKRHDVDGQKEAFDIQQLHKEYEDAINAWYIKVAQYIFDNFERHLYFHFTQPKKNAIDYIHPLGKLTLALDPVLIQTTRQVSLIGLEGYLLK